MTKYKVSERIPTNEDRGSLVFVRDFSYVDWGGPFLLREVQAHDTATFITHSGTPWEQARIAVPVKGHETPMEYQPSDIVPSPEDVGCKIFTRDNPSDRWNGPRELRQVQPEQTFPYKTLSGFRWRYAVIAVPEGTSHATNEDTTMAKHKTETTPFLHNTALLVMDDLVTIRAVHNRNNDDTPYTYACPREIAAQLSWYDPIVVQGNNGTYRVVYFQEADTDLDIDPNTEIMYAFVVAPVPLGLHEQRKRNHKELMQRILKEQRTQRKEQALRALGVNPESLSIGNDH